MPKITIYPSLVIGVGGTGSNTARYVKRRFLRTWNTHLNASHVKDELPPILEVLAVDTEALDNPPEAEPLHYHEFAPMGNFDAARLIQHKSNHSPYLDWWGWGDGTIPKIPLSYIHSGAKQLRPIGRLSFFRNYVTFKTQCENKWSQMSGYAIEDQVRENLFSVGPIRLIFIVSSVCGGTGSGMFLDTAFSMRALVKTQNVSIIGILMLPSVFERDIKVDIQRRRIKANAYAALKELSHFQRYPEEFEADYPSHGPLDPVAPPFDQIFLLEGFNTAGKTLSGSRAAEQMAAHLIHLLAFSNLNQQIIREDVNVHDVRTSKGGTQHLSYSSFGISALVLPLKLMWDYFLAIIPSWVVSEILKEEYDTVQTFQDYIALRNEIQTEFQNHATSLKDIDLLLENIGQRQERWHKFAQLISKHSKNILPSGLNALRYKLNPIIMERERKDQLHSEALAHPNQSRFNRPRFELRSIFHIPSFFEWQNERRLYNKKVTTWPTLVEALRKCATEWSNQASSLMTELGNASSRANDDAEQVKARLHPLRQVDGDENTSTFYDLETSAIGPEHLDTYLEVASDLLNTPTSSDPETTYWDVLITAVLDYILPDGANVFTPPPEEQKDGQRFLSHIRQLFESQSDLIEFHNELEGMFDIRNIVEVQKMMEGGLPTNYRLDQLLRRPRPHARVDGDIFPHYSANEQHTRVVAAPANASDGSKSSKSYHDATRNYGFTVVHSEGATRIDAVDIVHGIPVDQISSLEEMYRQYNHQDFHKEQLHLNPDWIKLREIYRDASTGTPPNAGAATQSPSGGSTPSPSSTGGGAVVGPPSGGSTPSSTGGGAAQVVSAGAPSSSIGGGAAQAVNAGAPLSSAPVNTVGNGSPTTSTSSTGVPASGSAGTPTSTNKKGGRGRI